MTKIGCVHRVPLFNNLACDERSEVQELLYHKTFQKREIIFSPDDPEQLSIVSSGAMKIYKLRNNLFVLLMRENMTERIISLVSQMILFMERQSKKQKYVSYINQISIS